MHFQRRQPVLVAAFFASAFFFCQNLLAQAPEHLVTPQDLSKAAQEATQTRQRNIGTLRSFLSSDKAKKALEQAHIDPKKVQDAVSSLSDQELAQLAQRATKAQNDFAAGMSDRDLLIVILLVAALILIIVAVH